MKILIYSLAFLLNIFSGDYTNLNSDNSATSGLNTYISQFDENNKNVNPSDYMNNQSKALIIDKNKVEMVDCTVRIKNEDMDLKITVHDISLYQCAKLKVGVWWHQTFG